MTSQVVSIVTVAGLAAAILGIEASPVFAQSGTLVAQSPPASYTPPPLNPPQEAPKIPPLPPTPPASYSPPPLKPPQEPPKIPPLPPVPRSP